MCSSQSICLTNAHDNGKSQFQYKKFQSFEQRKNFIFRRHTQKYLFDAKQVQLKSKWCEDFNVWKKKL